MRKIGIFWAFVVVMLVAFVAPKNVYSFDAESYFRGKTIRFITGSRPGGGTDILLRYLAGNWGKYFPGNPRFVVTNFPPHVHGLNFVWRSRGDGLKVFMHSTAILREQQLSQAEFKSSQFKFIGDIGDRTTIIGGYNLPYKDIRDAMGKDGPPLKYLDQIASPQDMNTQAFELMLLADWLKLPAEFGVIAERGTSITLLEMERGNMNVMVGGSGRWFGMPKLRPGWVAQGKLRPILDVTYFGAKMKGNSEMPDTSKVPQVYDLLNDKQKEIWTAMVEAPQAMNKPVVLSPKTPDHIVEVYRTALNKAMADKKFRSGIEKVTGLPADFVSAETATKEAVSSERLWSEYRDQEKKLRRKMYKKYISK
ncbi:MAG: hypothetical protein GTO40_22530 [Deltaproteobacteria bacterium]|nr:hypothetical protein [Deltaproteobacteria bacterium]